MAGPYNVPMPHAPKVTPEQTMGTTGQILADLPRHINAGYQGYQMGSQIEADQNQAAMQKDLQGVTAVAGFGKQAGQLNGEYIDTLKTAENSGMAPEQKAVVKEAIKTKYNGLYSQLKAKVMEDPVVAGFIQKSAPPETLDQFGDWHKNANLEMMDGMIGVLSKHDPEKAFEMQMAKETYLRELESHTAKEKLDAEKFDLDKRKGEAYISAQGATAKLREAQATKASKPKSPSENPSPENPYEDSKKTSAKKLARYKDLKGRKDAAEARGMELTNSQQIEYDALYNELGKINKTLRGSGNSAPVSGQSKIISEAKQAIARGADHAAVRKRLVEMGVDPVKAGL